MNARRVVAVVPDLFFAARIGATAEQLGVDLQTPATDAALGAIRSDRPDLVILDLAAPGDPIALARALKADPATHSIPLVGFYPHVDRPLRERALAAGVDRVMPRSAFTAGLPRLLAGDRDAGTPPAC